MSSTSQQLRVTRYEEKNAPAGAGDALGTQGKTGSDGVGTPCWRRAVVLGVNQPLGFTLSVQQDDGLSPREALAAAVAV